MRKRTIVILLIILNLCFTSNVCFADTSKVYKSAIEFDYPPFSVTENGVADGFQ